MRFRIRRFSTRRSLLGVLLLGVLLRGIYTLIFSSPVSLETRKIQGNLTASNSCVIPQYDPYDEELKKFFNDDEIWPPCPEFQSPFIIRPPNLLMLNKSHSANFPMDKKCVYKVIEGEKREGEEETAVDDPPVKFDPHLNTVVNGSFIRVDCGENETHFLHLPYRSKNLAAIKDAKMKKIAEEDSSSSSTSSSSPPLPSFNVYVVGIDSVSRLQSMRYLSKTQKFLLEELDAIEFEAYNKVGINTPPNFSAMMTGWPIEWDGRQFQGMKWQKTTSIWQEYSDRGFTTSYINDWDLTKWQTLEIIDKHSPPFDYRWRSSLKAVSDKLSNAACYRGQRNSDWGLEYFVNFLDAHRPFPNDRIFAWIWNSDWSHNYLNVQQAEKPSFSLFKRMKEKGDLENAVLLFLSDHGPRRSFHHHFVETPMGKTASNMPFLFLVIPPRLRKALPDLAVNARNNARRLVTAFDIHKTLQHLLHLQAKGADSWTNEAKDGSQESFSLMTPIPDNRTCDKAGIPPAFCNCETMVGTNSSSAASTVAAAALIKAINGALAKSADICETWMLHRVKSARKNAKREEYLVVVEAKPEFEARAVQAEFEGWVDMREGGDKAKVSMSQVYRHDRYGNTSDCVKGRDSSLREYCPCKK